MLQQNEEEMDRNEIEMHTNHEKKKKWHLCTNEIGAKVIFPDTTDAVGYDLYQTYRFKREPIPGDMIVRVSALSMISHPAMLLEFAHDISFSEFDPNTMMMFTKIVNGKICKCGRWLPDDAENCTFCNVKLEKCVCKSVYERGEK